MPSLSHCNKISPLNFLLCRCMCFSGYLHTTPGALQDYWTHLLITDCPLLPNPLPWDSTHSRLMKRVWQQSWIILIQTKIHILHLVSWAFSDIWKQLFLKLFHSASVMSLPPGPPPMCLAVPTKLLLLIYLYLHTCSLILVVIRVLLLLTLKGSFSITQGCPRHKGVLWKFLNKEWSQSCCLETEHKSTTCSISMFLTVTNHMTYNYHVKINKATFIILNFINTL